MLPTARTAYQTPTAEHAKSSEARLPLYCTPAHSKAFNACTCNASCKTAEKEEQKRKKGEETDVSGALRCALQHYLERFGRYSEL